MKLIFIRHGETNFNKLGIVQGQENDTVLNDRGRLQVEEITAQLAQNEIREIFFSPLARAVQTAKIINAAFNKPINLDDRLKEFKYGTLAGKTWQEIETETGDAAIHEKDAGLVFDYRPFGGESIEDVKERLSAFLEDVRQAYVAETLLVTTHGGIIDTMHLLFPSAEKGMVTNASLHEFIL